MLRIGHDELDVDEERKQESMVTSEDGEEKAGTAQAQVLAGNADKMSFPETTSQMIGRKTEVQQRNEFERNARGKQDIVKLFKWPREGV